MTTARGFCNKEVCRRIVVALICVVLSACEGDQVGSNLDQNRANRMIAVLSSNGIAATAKKESGGRGAFGVWVDARDHGSASLLIDEKGLLERGESSIEELLSNQGILPGSREIEQIKIDRIRALELERLIQNLPGVTAAKSVVRMTFLKEGEKPTASLVVGTEPDSHIRMEDITPIVQRSLPGVAVEDILVSMHSGEMNSALREQIGVLNIKGKPVPLALESFLGLWRVTKDDYSSLAFSLIVIVVLCTFIGGVAGYWYSYFVQSRHILEQHDLVPKVTRVDLSRLERSRVSDDEGRL